MSRRRTENLSVGFSERDKKAICLSPLAAPLQEGLDIVRRGDVTPTAGGGESKIAVPSSDVEHLLTGPQVEGFGELLADNLQRRANNGVVT